MRENSDRKSDRNYVKSVEKAGSDRSAVDVWTWRNKSNVLMAEKSSSLETDKRSERERT